MITTGFPEMRAIRKLSKIAKRPNRTSKRSSKRRSKTTMRVARTPSKIPKRSIPKMKTRPMITKILRKIRRNRRRRPSSNRRKVRSQKNRTRR